MSKQRTRKFVTKILKKTCSSLEKIISDREINFKQNKCNKLQKMSTNMGSSTVQLQYVHTVTKNMEIFDLKSYTHNLINILSNRSNNAKIDESPLKIVLYVRHW